MITKIQAQYQAKRFGIDVFTIYREYLQIVILNVLFSLDESVDLIFKGGTALRLIYGSPRFSEDLDFTAHCTEKKVQTILELLNEQIKNEIPNIEFKYLNSLAGLQGKFYQSIEVATQRLTVKTDFSFRSRVKNVNQTVIETSFPVVSFSLLQVMAKKEILSEKIGAILTRSRGRDIYDLWWLLNNQVKYDQALISEKLKPLGVKYDKKKIINKIKKYPKNKLFHELNKFLPLNDRKILPKLSDLLIAKLVSSER